ncbi:hypothetical protein BDY17DRAFT_169094 [Neohortaea acidophila]|uniref:DOMON domain-containing protein n=1 Tax=Neohortaea acidophila TaxID=245834 RepID=A0A6A6PPW9_9PEZI|nr:uncharacterized protein BDY17DRAFT_169094 [Neohortaea acidophila]KAF2481674.1 hypothetical protein BDY17DRAFT_169094 [Neohortaea acidophila]
MTTLYTNRPPPAVATSAQHLSQQCPSSDICYQLNIPAETASSGSGDVFFQISGSSSYSWIGLGQGSQMAGSNIFMVYADGNGNVTLSPRLGTGEVEPEYNTAMNVTLLEGSGIANGRMTANVKCSNCNQWNGGSMDFSDQSAEWIWAALSGDAIDSSSVSEGMKQHSAHGSFSWDMASAQGGAAANPFITTDGTPVSAPPAPLSPATQGPPSASDAMVLAHGAMAAIVFVALFPIGAIVIRIPGLKHAVWIHGAVQVFSYTVFVVAACLGIYIATIQEQLTAAHPIIGMVLLGVLFFQPFFGLVHHRLFKPKQQRTASSYAHIWLGRAAIPLGMINGGLGLQLAGPLSTSSIAAYGAIAGIMGVIYIAVAIWGDVRRRKDQQKLAQEKMEGA